MSTANKPLGRRPPPDFDHVEKYPLTALPPTEIPTGVPVVIGVNWYEDFDTPVLDAHGQYWIARDGIKGSIRGGHCVCLKTHALTDLSSWWTFYDQGAEGACVGFGTSRMMTLLNRKRYNARWLWDQAKLGDSWPDTNPGDDQGTTVRAALSVLRSQGHVPWTPRMGSLDVKQRDALPGRQPEGIAAYRWATTVEQVTQVLASPNQEKRGAVYILNSWGRDWPHGCWMPYEVLDRLILENGEVGLVVDK